MLLTENDGSASQDSLKVVKWKKLVDKKLKPVWKYKEWICLPLYIIPSVYQIAEKVATFYCRKYNLVRKGDVKSFTIIFSAPKETMNKILKILPNV